METFQQLKSELLAAEIEAQKFYEKQNDAAGTRLRKAMLVIKTLAQDVRAEVQNRKNQPTPPTP